MTPRTNRVIRDQIQELHGSHIVTEIERWNGSAAENLADHGLDLPHNEAAVQADHMQMLVIEEEVFGGEPNEG